MGCDYISAIDTILDYGGFIIEADDEVAVMHFREGVFIVTMRGRPENVVPMHGKTFSVDDIMELPYVVGVWPVDFVDVDV